MLIKILLTLLAIVIAMLMLKHRGSTRGQQTESAAYGNARLPSKRWIAIASLFVLLSGLWGWDRYQTYYQVLEVRVYALGESEPQRYQVYQGEIDGRRFTTIHGLQVQLGAEDRLVIVP